MLSILTSIFANFMYSLTLKKNEIQQSYVHGFTPYRLHKNADGTFVTPIRVYNGKVYELDDVATMEVEI